MPGPTQFSPASQAIIDGDSQEALQLVESALASGKSAAAVLDELTQGIHEVGNRFGTGEFFLPDLMAGAKAMKGAMARLEPELAKLTSRQSDSAGKARILLGSVKGDLHDIGRSLVGLMLEVNGYEVHDLGVDVPSERFITEAQRLNVDVIGLSSLLTTTARQAESLIGRLIDAGLRKRYLVVVGGAATSSGFAEEIGADGWAENATDAVKLVGGLLVASRGTR